MKIENSKLKIIFFGSSKFVLPIIEKLSGQYKLFVVTTEMNPLDAVPAFCQKNSIPFIAIKQFNNEAMEQLKKLNAPAAVLADFGIILPPAILSLFPKGIINSHPSLLPKYRGPIPVQTALLNGEQTTGISIIKLDDDVDHGPILIQKEEDIFANDTAESLYTRLFAQSAEMLLEVLPKYLEGKLELTQQDHTKATFTQHLTRQSGFIDVNNIPNKEKLKNMIRAYYPWPGVWTTIRIKNQELRIKFLPNELIQVEGKKPVSYKDFVNGYPEMKEFIEKLRS